MQCWQNEKSLRIFHHFDFRMLTPTASLAVTSVTQTIATFAVLHICGQPGDNENMTIYSRSNMQAVHYDQF